MLRFVNFHFYPRPPRGGRRAAVGVLTLDGQFLSTPSARRATWQVDGTTGRLENFYPRPPRGGRPSTSRRAAQPQPISIHALREEGDSVLKQTDKGDVEFLSTPSARRATLTIWASIPPARNFYPRPPRGGRPSQWLLRNTRSGFLSTPSARRATREPQPRKYLQSYFYPRPPRGGRRRTEPSCAVSRNFYPRPPRGGRQQKQRQKLYFQTNYTTFCTNLEEP